MTIATSAYGSPYYRDASDLTTVELAQAKAARDAAIAACRTAKTSDEINACIAIQSDEIVACAAIFRALKGRGCVSPLNLLLGAYESPGVYSGFDFEVAVKFGAVSSSSR